MSGKEILQLRLIRFFIITICFIILTRVLDEYSSVFCGIYTIYSIYEIYKTLYPYKNKKEDKGYAQKLTEPVAQVPEDVTIDGYVARDEDGKLSLNRLYPERSFDDDRNVGIWGNSIGFQMIIPNSFYQ